MMPMMQMPNMMTPPAGGEKGADGQPVMNQQMMFD